ncbi:phenylalanine 4-monooxygenase [soil metagenome]
MESIKRKDSAAPVELADDHPGVGDTVYRARRDEIAEAARQLGPDDDAAPIVYTDEETATWATASNALDELHREYACAAYLDGVARLDLPRDRVPQIADVSARLGQLTEWRFRAAPGLAPIREFYGGLGRRTFMSTQYVRHPSVPLYTPEPDIIHELVGHANALAEPRFAELYATAGEAGTRASDDELQRFSKTFWFTLEFGVVREDDAVKAYGAGLLSSYGELQKFREAEIRGWDPDEMAVTDYDIDTYQPVLFAAPDFDTMVTDLTRWFESI